MTGLVLALRAALVPRPLLAALTLPAAAFLVGLPASPLEVEPAQELGVVVRGERTGGGFLGFMQGAAGDEVGDRADERHQDEEQPGGPGQPSHITPIGAEAVDERVHHDPDDHEDGDHAQHSSTVRSPAARGAAHPRALTSTPAAGTTAAVRVLSGRPSRWPWTASMPSERAASSCVCVSTPTAVQTRPRRVVSRTVATTRRSSTPRSAVSDRSSFTPVSGSSRSAAIDRPAAPKLSSTTPTPASRSAPSTIRPASASSNAVAAGTSTVRADGPSPTASSACRIVAATPGPLSCSGATLTDRVAAWSAVRRSRRASRPWASTGVPSRAASPDRRAAGTNRDGGTLVPSARVQRASASNP